MAERPILALPPPTNIAPRKGQSPRETVGPVSSERQGVRLGPKFDRLATVLDTPERLAEFQDDPSSIVPERAIVFEVAGSLVDFYGACRAIGLELLGEDEIDFEPDDDFSTQKDGAAVPARVYFTLPDVQALRQLVSLWKIYVVNRRLPMGRRSWENVFSHLIDVRPWGPKDRITEEAIQDWQERLLTFPDQPIKFEAEFWYQTSEERRSAAERLFIARLEEIGGQSLHVATIPAIRYHAILGEVPPEVINDILEDNSVSLVTADEVMVLRPQSVVGEPVNTDDTEGPAAVTPEEVEELGAPLVALLDGLPMAGHQLLQPFLDIDDPDDFAASYGNVAAQRHGTAMASLIIHGDLDKPNDALRTRLYARPVMQQVQGTDFDERMPSNILGVDLIWRAFIRMFDGENGDPAAPTVRIVNISLGDAKRPFMGIMSPWAKLLDYLASHYGVLILVSAGNILKPIPIEGVATWADIETAQPEDRQNRILSSVLTNRSERRILAPSEALNVLTVGACHDETLHSNGAGVMAAQAYTNPSLPNPSSALGFGYKRSIKPEVLFPGGKEQLRSSTSHAPLSLTPGGSPSGYFGVRTAKPSASLGATYRVNGTSVATALAAHDAAKVVESIIDLPNEDVHPAVPGEILGLAAKSLIVHAARWDDEAAQVLSEIVNPSKSLHWSHEREELTRMFGYGRPDINRVIDCSTGRVTLLGWGQIEADGANEFRIPLPPDLEGIKGFRAVTITVAWFAPTNFRHRAYRTIKLSADASQDKKFSLGIEAAGTQPTHYAVDRGTVFHRRWEGSKATPFVDDGDLVFRVSCKPTTDDKDIAVHYSVVVTLEVGEEVSVQVYQQVRAAIQAKIAIQA